jgi:hypothetical protein
MLETPADMDGAEPRRYPNLRPPWKKGETGNKLGMSIGTRDRRSAQAILNGSAAQAARVIRDTIKGKNESVMRLQAARDCLDRVLGKPKQQVDVALELKRKISDLSVAELVELRTKLQASMAVAPLLIEAVAEPLELEPEEDIVPHTLIDIIEKFGNCPNPPTDFPTERNESTYRTIWYS